MTFEEPQTCHVLVIEDIADTREWLKCVAREAFPAATISLAACLADAMAWLRDQKDSSGIVALVDLRLPDGSGIDFIRALLTRVPQARAIVTTLYDDDDNLIAAMAVGAQGYLLKDHEPGEIVRRLRALERGESPLSPAMAERMLELFRRHARFIQSHAPEQHLTPRETDVLRLVGRGLKISEAADTLGLSAATVAGYLKTIYRKLDIGSRAEAAVEAVRRGLV
ncbi:response regulator [Novosphingobium sp. JCM 18896]|uniref:response regulator n=1 Tax=Novosphingobium sp. JCM 18896 TaxID=2989731 RepID=UPI0022219498|nr:response regulator transcription factor [Novosphingobium sp. JCM 18896]MCW1432262.1 response regulator transcription factor [Novosphingobium sp. JCM 18896]